MKHAVFAMALLISFAGICRAEAGRERFDTIVAQEQSAPAAALDAMMRLAEKGYAPALDRVGFYFRHGIGTEQDLDAAQVWYARAVSAGHPWSAASLARVHMLLGHGDAAYEVLQAATAKNAPGAERVLATAHIDGKLGAMSDPALGVRLLENMAATGNRKAARDLVVRVTWGRAPAPISDTAVDLTVQSGLEGNARFAEAALAYLSLHGAQDSATIQTRAALIETPGLRDRVLSVERTRLAADQNPGHFWAEVEEVLANTEAGNYARAASTAFWINKNAWVRVLQIELTSLGYYTGRVDGRMTKKTISAQNEFCRRSGIWRDCVRGPLRGTTVRAVAHAIAHLKHDT